MTMRADHDEIAVLRALVRAACTSCWLSDREATLVMHPEVDGRTRGAIVAVAAKALPDVPYEHLRHVLDRALSQRGR